MEIRGGREEISVEAGPQTTTTSFFWRNRNKATSEILKQDTRTDTSSTHHDLYHKTNDVRKQTKVRECRVETNQDGPRRNKRDFKTGSKGYTYEMVGACCLRCVFISAVAAKIPS
jgi:hypothetical protein